MEYTDYQRINWLANHPEFKANIPADSINPIWTYRELVDKAIQESKKWVE